MMIAAKPKFKPNAVLIPADATPQVTGGTLDPADCTLLMLDSKGNDGPLYTKAEWEANAEPRLYRNDSRGHIDGLEPGEVVELLPTMVIYKSEEREYWLDPYVLERTKAIYAVYAVNTLRHVHICSITPNYEGYYLGKQYVPSRELSDEENQEVFERITQGSIDENQIEYFDVGLVDRHLKTVCRQGDTPPGNVAGGGYPIEVDAVRTEDAYIELQERHCRSEL